MAMGLLGAALSGGAEAAQDNAKIRMKKKHDEAILQLRQRHQTSERVAGQKFTAGENQQDREFRAGESEADRAQRLQLAQMQERGANSRAALGDWNVMQTADGTPVRINARTGVMEPIQGAGDFDFGDGGALTDRENAQLSEWQKRRTMLNDQLSGDIPLEPEKQEEVRRDIEDLNAKIGRLTSPPTAGGGLDVNAETDTALGGGSQAGSNGAGGNATGSSAPPRRSISGQAQEIQSARRETEADVAAKQEVTNARDAADAMLQRIEREQRGGGRRGGLLSQANIAAGRAGPSEETMSEAQQVAQQIVSLDQNGRLSDSDRKALAERLVRLQEAGVPVNLNQ